MGGQQKRPLQRRRDKPEPVQSAAELARSDAGALTTTLLRAWAWHPHAAGLIQDTAAQSLPLNFDPVESYQQLFQPLIVAEACAGLQKQFQEEVGSRNGLVLDVTLKRVAQVSDQRADVECTLRARSPHVLTAALRKLKQEWGIVLLCSSRPAGGSLETFCAGGGAAAARSGGNGAKAAVARGSHAAPAPTGERAPSAAASAASRSDATLHSASNARAPSHGETSPPADSDASTAPRPSGPPGAQPLPWRSRPSSARPNSSSGPRPTPPPSPPPGDAPPLVVVAGYVKYCPKTSGELMLLEVQTGFDPLPCQGAAAKHPCPGALQQLLQAFEPGGGGGGAPRAPGEGGPQWALVFLGAPVTPQREMAALEAMTRQPLLQTIAQPSKCLAELGCGSLRKVWPAEARSQMFFNRLKAQFDESQLEAIEYCASLVARPEQAAADLGGQPVLPIVLIQGPPGTGKTHTVKGILNTWHIALFQRSYDSLNAHLEAKLEAARNPAHAGPSVPPKALDTCPLGTSQQVERVARPRILVCAPSNAATDELLERVLSDRFADLNGDPYTPSLLRIGSEAAKDTNLSDAAKQVYEENMCREMFALPPEAIRTNLRARQSELHQCTTSFTLCWHKLKQDLLEGERQAEMISLVKLAEDERRAKANVERWTAVNECVNLRTRTQWEAEEAVALSFMEDAEIVFTTLSSTGRRLFSRISRPFDLVLIDEAAQASEVASLQPLVLGSGRLVMVGDPQQLPATVLSKAAKALNFERSLFERLMSAGWPVKMLSVQYRMHRSIRSFPSKHFYDDRLRDGANVVNRPHMPYYDHGLLKPYVIFDVEAGRDVQHGDGGSRFNVEEINMALALFQELSAFLNKLVEEARAQNKPGPPGARVGIITPYRKQVEKMREAFAAVLGPDVARDVKIDTVDSFQGKQMDVIILSCVRGSAAKPDRNTNTQALLGFVKDVRRMNVAITRAQSALWILGNVATLSMDDTWKALIDDGRSRNNKGGVIVEKADAAELFPDAKLWDHRASAGAAPRGVKRSAQSAGPDGDEWTERGAVAESRAREGAGMRANAHAPRQGGGGGGAAVRAVGPSADKAGLREALPGISRDPRKGSPAQNRAIQPHELGNGGTATVGGQGAAAASIAPGGMAHPGMGRGGSASGPHVALMRSQPTDPRSRTAAAGACEGPSSKSNVVTMMPKR